MQRRRLAEENEKVEYLLRNLFRIDMLFSSHFFFFIYKTFKENNRSHELLLRHVLRNSPPASSVTAKHLIIYFQNKTKKSK